MDTKKDRIWFVLKFVSRIFIFIILIIGTLSCDSFKKDDTTYEKVRDSFLSPSASAKPKVYWWCLNGNIDTLRAKQELAAMKEAGIGGFDFFEIGVPKGDLMIPGGPAFLSDESLEIIKYVIIEAGKLNLSVGLNLASSWNAGGSWVKPEHGGKSLYASEINIKGNSELQNIHIPFPEVTFPAKDIIGQAGKPMVPFQENGKPVYFEEVTILAIPANFEKQKLDTAQIIDVSPYFDSENDILRWTVPDGDWNIHRYICSNSGQHLVLPSPLSDGLTIDHFDSIAVRTHLMYIINRLKTVLGDFRNTALKSFYLASYEARGFVWTSSLASEFENVNGYEIVKFIPSLFDSNLFSLETTSKVQDDFRKTLSELMINNLYKKSKEICNRYGLMINCEAGGPGYPLYNGPAEPLKALGNLDIPRGEFWINHSRNYVDIKGDQEVDILRVVKEVAAASHIYEKGIVEEEAFTSFQHWQEGPFDMKPFGDRAFCEGMNRVVFHGFSHNPSGSGFPGYVYGAGTHFNDKRVWWSLAKPFVDYVSRISAVFQETEFTADVLYYYGDKIPNSATPKNTHFNPGPGFDYEVINTDILLNNLTVEDGKLVLSSGGIFRLLALEDEPYINPEVIIRLKELAARGAIIIGNVPKGIKVTKSSGIVKEDGNIIINDLWQEIGNSPDEILKNGRIISGLEPNEMLRRLKIKPDIDYPDKESYLIDFIHYKKGELDLYFICNTSDEYVSRLCSFRQIGKIPEIWDPVSGEIIPISIYNSENDYTHIPLTLPPYGSQIVAFKKAKALPHFSHILYGTKHPPRLLFTKDGVLILDEGAFELKDQDKSTLVKNSINYQNVSGDWELLLKEGLGVPDKINLPELISWTDSEIEGLKYFSGIGTYKKTISYKVLPDISGKQKIYLDLGELSKVGEVWLNGQNMGIAWTKPYVFDVTDHILYGDNELVVDVANTWSNRLTGDAITGRNFTNTNISNTILPVKGLLPGDQTRVKWKDVPLIESGLLGPVKIISIIK